MQEAGTMFVCTNGCFLTIFETNIIYSGKDSFTGITDKDHNNLMKAHRIEQKQIQVRSNNKWFSTVRTKYEIDL